MSVSIGSLFSGIGGLELRMRDAGFGEPIWHVEIEPFARRVLSRHWPNVPLYEDVRKVGKKNLATVDVLVGGAPCQGFSQAGKRKGFCDPRSALWGEMARIIGELRPKAVIFENVIEMLRKGDHKRVMRDLRDLGYVVDEPLVINAAALGAPHKRTRIFIVAYRKGTTLGKKLAPLPNKPPSFVYPALRGEEPEAWEPPRALVKAKRYPGLFKADRIRALGNAVMPEMGFVAAMRLRYLLTGENPYHIDWESLSKLPSSAERRWPTPVTTDKGGARKETARKKNWKSKPGTTLTDALWLEGDWGKPLNPAWVEALMGFDKSFTLP